MQQFIFLIGISAILFGLFFIFKFKTNSGLFIILSGGILVATAYILAYYNESPPLQQKEFRIKIVGSRTIGQSLMPNLAKQYLVANQFQIFEQEEKPNYLRISARRKKEDKFLEILHIEIHSLGTLKGFESLKEGHCDIAMASNQISEDIIKALSLGFRREKNEHIIAFDALRIIAQQSVKSEIQGLLLSDIEQILQGKMSDWSKLSTKKKGSIHLYLRDSNSGTYQYIHEHFLAHALPDSTQAVANITQFDFFEKIANKVTEDSFSLGFIDFGIDSLMLENTYTLGILGKDSICIFPDAENIKSRKYPLTRPLYLYTTGNIEKQEQVKQFIDFCKSPAAGEIVRKERFVPL